MTVWMNVSMLSLACSHCLLKHVAANNHTSLVSPWSQKACCFTHDSSTTSAMPTNLPPRQTPGLEPASGTPCPIAHLTLRSLMHTEFVWALRATAAWGESTKSLGFPVGTTTLKLWGEIQTEFLARTSKINYAKLSMFCISSVVGINIFLTSRLPSTQHTIAFRYS